MKNNWIKLTSLLLTAALFASCGYARSFGLQAGEESPAPEPPVQSREELSALEEEIPDITKSPLLEPRQSEIRLYLYRPDSEVYQASEPVEADTLLELVEAVGTALDLEPELKEIRQRRGTIYLNFMESFVREALADPQTERAFLNSVCATLSENHITAEWFCFEIEDYAYESANLSILFDVPFEPAALKFGEGTAESYEAIRAQIPYGGFSGYHDHVAELSVNQTDETGRELIRFLAYVGDPGQNVESPSELSNEYRLEKAIYATPILISADDSSDRYYPQLLPITAAVNDYEVLLKEHVERSAMELFGISTLQHQDTEPRWTWHPEEGVYTPPHMGGGGSDVPVIFALREEADRYELELSYLFYGIDAFLNEDGSIIPQDQARDYVAGLPRRLVVVGKRAGGGFVFQSHRYME